MRVFASKTTLVSFASLLYLVSIPVFAGSSYVTATNPLITAGAEIADSDNIDPIPIDFDNDGDIDFIVYNTATSNYTKLFTNNGLGSFSESTIPFVISSPRLVFINDVDNDGDDDITEIISGGVRYQRNNGNGTFTQVTHPVVAAGGVLEFSGFIDTFPIDANNDGAIDWVTFNEGSNTYSTLYLNNGSGGYSATSLGISGLASVLQIRVGDVNNDGADDVTYIDRDTGTVSYFQNNGSGSFTSLDHPVAEAGATLAFFVSNRYEVDFLQQDYDADGDLDFFVYGTSTYDVVYLNNGSGSFSSITAPFGLRNVTIWPGSSTLSKRGNLFVDLDNDGDDDVIISTGGANSTYRRHDGTVGGTNNRPPRLSSTSPADGSSGLAPTANISLTFDESISSVSNKRINIYRQSNDSLVESIAANNSSRVSTFGSTVTVNPTSDLLASTGYYVQVEAGALFDADGMTYKGIDDKTTFNFTTGTAGVALSTNPMLTFTNDNPSSPGIFTDGSGGSVDVAGVQFELADYGDNNLNRLTSAEWVNNSFLASNDPSFGALTFPGAGNAGTKGFGISTADGSQFTLTSFVYYNWGESTPFENTAYGYRDGAQVATHTFNGFDPEYDPITVTLPTAFNNVDRVVVTITSGGYQGDQSLTNHSYNSFVVGPAVANTAPTITNPIADNFSVGEDSGNSTFTLANRFTDAETDASSLIYSVEANNNTAVVGASINNSTDVLTLSYAANTSGSATITIRATDAGGLFVEDTFTVTVLAVNDAPTDLTLSNASVNQSGGINAVVGTLSTTDVDDVNHTYTLVSGTGSTDNASFNISSNSLRANNAAAMAAGTYSVRVRTTDAGNLFVEEVFTITVVDNVAPSFVSGTPTMTNIGQSTATLNIIGDEPSRFYFVVLPDGATAPTATQVFNLQDASGASVAINGQQSVNANVNSTFPISGLSLGTAYDLYVAAFDFADPRNNQSAPTLVEFTTESADADGNLIAGPSYSFSLASTVDTVGEAVDVFGFT
ncbi:FG-GAP-like repeat-containing protein, partial [Pseudidiomarina aestuarii]|uniref:FG-GAP-like repeat-containing protein n=1 Tax=Pseudidiomarina aestuarii TaxID=624146 RepID=UPI003A973F94